MPRNRGVGGEKSAAWPWLDNAFRHHIPTNDVLRLGAQRETEHIIIPEELI